MTTRKRPDTISALGRSLRVGLRYRTGGLRP